MTARLGLAVFLSTLCIAADALCWTHVARGGETLIQLSVRYYGTANMTMVIRAANGFVHPDDGRLTEGEQVEIPETIIYRFQADDTWESIADRYLASSKRGSFLASMNNFEDGQKPPAGTLVKLPYHLRHIFAAGETLKSVTKIYLGNKVLPKWLIAYNFSHKKTFQRGDVLIVPLINLDFTKEEQAKIDKERAHSGTIAELADQELAPNGIAKIIEVYDKGEYVRAIAIAERIMGRGGLNVPQEIAINNYLAFSYIALGEDDLAVKAFKRAIELEPGMELSPITTSPKILTVFNRAKGLKTGKMRTVK